MHTFAILFGSVLGLGSLVGLIASIVGRNMGGLILSVFFGILGLILVYVGKNTRPTPARQAQSSVRTVPDQTKAVVASPTTPAPGTGSRPTVARGQHVAPESAGGKVYYERDNMGTRQDTFDKAVSYWAARRGLVEPPPFVLYVFSREEDARDALLELPCIHVAADSNRLICTDVMTFGYYPIAGSYEAFLGDGDLTYELWEKARNSFVKHGGTLKNEQAPAKKETAHSGAPVQLDSVKFIREQHVNDQYGDTVYRVYQAPDADTAKEFLSRNPVDKRLYYIVVETPEGNYGRDIDGIYKEGERRS
ncbi:MAG: hypothetical protein ACM3WU_12560 [Bacillota bacterium]